MPQKLNDKWCTYAHHPLVQLHASASVGHTTAHHRSSLCATSLHSTTYDTCMRFSSSTSPFLMPQSAEVTAHAALFPTMRNIILGLCTHIRRTLLALGTALRASTHTHRIHRNLYYELTPRLGTYHHWPQAPSNKFCLIRPYNRGTRGHLAWDLPIPDALSSHDELQSYFKAVSSTRYTRVYIIYR